MRKLLYIQIGRHTQFFFSVELLLALFVLWLGAIMHQSDAISIRYPKTYWIWQFVSDKNIDDIAPVYCAISAILIIIGLFMVAAQNGRAHILRGTGIFMAMILMLFIAIGHLSITFYSVGGASYLMLAVITLSVLYQATRRS